LTTYKDCVKEKGVVACTPIKGNLDTCGKEAIHKANNDPHFNWEM